MTSDPERWLLMAAPPLLCEGSVLGGEKGARRYAGRDSSTLLWRVGRSEGRGRRGFVCLWPPPTGEWKTGESRQPVIFYFFDLTTSEEQTSSIKKKKGKIFPSSFACIFPLDFSKYLSTHFSFP